MKFLPTTCLLLIIVANFYARGLEIKEQNTNAIHSRITSADEEIIKVGSHIQCSAVCMQRYYCDAFYYENGGDCHIYYDVEGYTDDASFNTHFVSDTIEGITSSMATTTPLNTPTTTPAIIYTQQASSEYRKLDDKRWIKAYSIQKTWDKALAYCKQIDSGVDGTIFYPKNSSDASEILTEHSNTFSEYFKTMWIGLHDKDQKNSEDTSSKNSPMGMEGWTWMDGTECTELFSPLKIEDDDSKDDSQNDYAFVKRDPSETAVTVRFEDKKFIADGFICQIDKSSDN